MSISTVYKLINDVDDKVYIGSTTSKISKRMTEHRKSARVREKDVKVKVKVLISQMHKGHWINSVKREFS